MKLVNKTVGRTPLEMIRKLKIDNPDLKDVKMAYAGRLDPMADGLLVILEGEECKNRDYYQDLTKIYEFEILFGFSTDSYDLLGVIQERIDSGHKKRITRTELDSCLKKYKKSWLMEYPPYSSKTIDGIPMFSLARAGLLDLSDLPIKETKIFDVEILSEREITSSEILAKVNSVIPNIIGNFRQKGIVKKWHSVLDNGENVFQLFRLRATVESGTYIRSLAKSIGKDIGVPSLAYSITRTRVGKHKMRVSSI